MRIIIGKPDVADQASRVVSSTTGQTKRLTHHGENRLIVLRENNKFHRLKKNGARASYIIVNIVYIKYIYTNTHKQSTNDDGNERAAVQNVNGIIITLASMPVGAAGQNSNECVINEYTVVGVVLSKGTQ